MEDNIDLKRVHVRMVGVGWEGMEQWYCKGCAIIGVPCNILVIWINKKIWEYMTFFRPQMTFVIFDLLRKSKVFI